VRQGAHARRTAHAARRMSASSAAQASMVLCVPLAPTDDAPAAVLPAPGELTTSLAAALAAALGVGGSQLTPLPADAAAHVLAIEILPPLSARERSAQTLAVQATAMLRGGPSAAMLAAEPRLKALDGRAEPVSVVGVTRTPAASVATALATPIALVAAACVGAALLVAACLCRRSRKVRAAPTASDEDLLRIRNRYESRLAQAEAASLLGAAVDRSASPSDS
jgi:hypothetical protein